MMNFRTFINTIKVALFHSLGIQVRYGRARVPENARNWLPVVLA